MYLRSRSSCSPTIKKYRLAPLTIIDYIVVHELVHLIHKDHSKAFWNELDKVMPDYLERKD